MSKLFNSNILSIIYLAILAVLWGSVLIIGGSIGPYAWWGLMAFGAVGIVTVLICVIISLVIAIKKHTISKRILMLLCISIFISWPAIWLFDKDSQIAYPADIDSVKPSVSIRSPFEKPVIVAWGGNNIKDNYHVWLSFERWAYDLFASPAVLESQRLEDYGVYGMDVVAPISGYVVGAYDQEKEHGTGDEEAEKAVSTLGNYVFIKIEETGTYLVLGHLKYDSVCVKVGDYVTEGTVIAKAGNSGSSSEPHLHIHHQRQDPNEQLLLAQGLPLYFRDINGSAMPKGGGDTKKNGVRVPNGETITPIEK